jgi:hypothetical protein
LKKRYGLKAGSQYRTPFLLYISFAANTSFAVSPKPRVYAGETPSARAAVAIVRIKYQFCSRREVDENRLLARHLPVYRANARSTGFL